MKKSLKGLAYEEVSLPLLLIVQVVGKSNFIVNIMLGLVSNMGPIQPTFEHIGMKFAMMSPSWGCLVQKVVCF